MAKRLRKTNAPLGAPPPLVGNTYTQADIQALDEAIARTAAKREQINAPPAAPMGPPAPTMAPQEPSPYSYTDILPGGQQAQQVREPFTPEEFQLPMQDGQAPSPTAVGNAARNEYLSSGAAKAEERTMARWAEEAETEERIGRSRLVNGIQDGEYSPEKAAQIGQRHGFGDYDGLLADYEQLLPPEAQFARAEQRAKKEELTDPFAKKMRKAQPLMDALSKLEKDDPLRLTLTREIRGVIGGGGQAPDFVGPQQEAPPRPEDVLIDAQERGQLEAARDVASDVTLQPLSNYLTPTDPENPDSTELDAMVDELSTAGIEQGRLSQLRDFVTKLENILGSADMDTKRRILTKLSQSESFRKLANKEARGFWGEVITSFSFLTPGGIKKYKKMEALMDRLNKLTQG